ETLDFVHKEHKLVHRDLKPGNVIIDKSGRPRLCDFGISAPLSASLIRVTGWVAQGTLCYMSPQQLFGQEPHPSDDIYALGALLYECFTGKPPFHEGYLPAQIERLAPTEIASKRRQENLQPMPWEAR